MGVVRTYTPMNAIAEAILERLAGISHRKDSAYITSPRSVARLAVLGDFAGMAKPLVALTCLGWEVEPQSGRRFEGTLAFGVHCITENTADAEGELLNLVSDVLYALEQDVTVDGQAVYLFPTGFEPNVDLTNRTGLAVTTVRFECRYKYDAVAP
jgi:hypothetical protein